MPTTSDGPQSRIEIDAHGQQLVPSTAMARDAQCRLSMAPAEATPRSAPPAVRATRDASYCHPDCSSTQQRRWL